MNLTRPLWAQPGITGTAREGGVAAVGCQQRCSHTSRSPQRRSCRVLMAQTAPVHTRGIRSQVI